MEEKIFSHSEAYLENPFEMFSLWFEEAKECKEIKDATALSLATSSKGGRPSVRIVLLKNFDRKGFTFFTNANSHKGRNITTNPQAEMCFYWEPLGKQIRIYGNIEEISTEESDLYFSSRHKISQLASSVSKQSSELDSYGKLKEEFLHAQANLGSNTIKRPEHWRGFRISPKEFEFWLDGAYRLHLRHKYKLIENSWTHKFLYP